MMVYRKGGTGIMKKHKKNKKNDRLLYAIMIVCLILIIIFGGKLIKYYWDAWQAEKAISSLADLILTDEELLIAETSDDDTGEGVKSAYSNRYALLVEQNEDFVGWIEIEGTDISYPVMYTPDDPEYYLHRNFDKEYEYSGLPFIDSDCSLDPRSTNIVIYGHNMKNGTMFHQLMNYKDQDFYEEHKIVTFHTIYGDGEYEIVAVILAQALSEGEEGFRYYDVIDIDSEEEFEEYMENIHALELYDTGVEAVYGDQFLTLSTCEYSQDDGRLAVIARKIN